VLIVSAIAALMATGATAAEERRFQVTPFFSYASGDDLENSVGEKREVDDESGWGLSLDYALEPSRFYQFFYAGFSTEAQGDAAPIDLDIHYLQLGGTVALADTKRVIPYFGMTIGAARFSPDQSGLEHATKFAFTVGAGLRVPFNDRIGMRAEWRTYATVLGSDSDLFCKSDVEGAACALKSKGDMFFQHSAQLGFTVGF
jgi:opacity protein-like surface antigen